MSNNIIKACLSKAYAIGRCINFNGVYRVKSHGKGLDHLPGGKGVVEMDLEWICEGTKTMVELQKLEAGSGIGPVD